jgi:hypothetical protein
MPHTPICFFAVGAWWGRSNGERQCGKQSAGASRSPPERGAGPTQKRARLVRGWTMFAPTGGSTWATAASGRDRNEVSDAPFIPLPYGAGAF